MPRHNTWVSIEYPWLLSAALPVIKQFNLITMSALIFMNNKFINRQVIFLKVDNSVAKTAVNTAVNTGAIYPCDQKGFLKQVIAIKISIFHIIFHHSRRMDRYFMMTHQWYMNPTLGICCAVDINIFIALHLIIRLEVIAITL